MDYGKCWLLWWDFPEVEQQEEKRSQPTTPDTADVVAVEVDLQARSQNSQILWFREVMIANVTALAEGVQWQLEEILHEPARITMTIVPSWTDYEASEKKIIKLDPVWPFGTETHPDDWRHSFAWSKVLRGGETC